MAPVPQEMVARDTGEVLALTRNCSRFGWKIVDLEKPKTIPRRCPAYGFAGEVENHKESPLWLSFEDVGQNNSKHDFSFATGLVEALTELSQSTPSQEKTVIATQSYTSRNHASKMLVTPEITGPSRCSMPMLVSVIQRLIPNDLLVNPAGLAVRWETPKAVSTLHYEVRFLPASESEAAAFAKDKVVQRLCACNGDPNASLAGWVQEACDEFKAAEDDISREKVIARAWELGEFARVYVLRQEEVFYYDQEDRHRCA